MQYRKRIAQAFAAAGLALVMTVGTAFASFGTGTVTADALRMRSQPDTSAAIVAVISKGTDVELLSAEENGWYRVSCKGKEGYMSAQWLSVAASGSETAAESPAPAEEPEAESTAAVVTAGPLNVRSGPATSYSRVGSLSKGDEITILESLDDWCKISYGDLTGYVFAQYISTDIAAFRSQAESREGLVLSGPLNVRSGPGTSYARLGSLRVGSTLTVHSSANGWYYITCGNLTGYVSADYVTLMEEIGSSPVGAAAAALAASLVGSRYVYGAEGPNSFDCSGLAYYIYKQLGYTIARGSSSQYKSSGYFVSMSEMEPGDLIYIFDPKFDGSGGTLPTTHMGIYVGNGQFIHASTTTYRVQYDNVYNSYYTPYIVGVKRIV